ncbi:MAG: MFS transporter [Euryarchaeota archaeon]|nr:MFS transporter [Euryarchaeota archaeon]MDE2045635.1 MFS transporter [Thermoplasmata archaeon]
MRSTVEAATGARVPLWGNRNFALLCSGSIGSSLGNAVGYVVLTWLVYSATRSPLAIALLGVVEFLPSALFGILGGALVDRFDRRRLMVACDLGRFAILGALAADVLVRGSNVVLVLAAAFAVSGLGTLFRPARNALLPRLVRSERLTDATGLLESSGTASSFVGSPLGGALVVLLGALLGLALLLNALTFLVSAALLTWMVLPRRREAPASPPEMRASLLAEAREGLRFLRSQTALLAITISALVANFFLAMYNGFEIFYVTQQLHLTVAVFGVLLAANTAGFAIGPLLPGRVGTDRAPGVWFAVATGCAGLSVVVLGLTAYLPLAVALALLFAILQSFAGTCALSAEQRTVPEKVMGRYFATSEAGAFAMIPVGQIAGGFAVLLLGVGHTYVLAGVGGAFASFALLAIPSVRNWARLPAPGPARVSKA